VKKLLAGPAGSTVTLTVRRDGQEGEFLLHRAGLGAMSVRAETLQPGILRISVPSWKVRGLPVVWSVCWRIPRWRAGPSCWT